MEDHQQFRLGNAEGWQQLEQVLASTIAVNETLRETTAQLDTKLQARFAEVVDLTNLVVAREGTIDSLRTSLQELKADAKLAESSKAELLATIADRDARIAAVEAQVATVTEQWERQNTLRMKIEEAYQRLDQTLAATISENKALRETTQQLETKIEARFLEIADLTTMLLEKERVADALRAKIRTLDADRDDRAAAREAQLETLSARLGALEDELIAVRSTARTLIGDLVVAMDSVRGVDDATLHQILRSTLRFDDSEYLAKYPDVAAAGMDAMTHYLRHGAGEYRSPHSSINHKD